MPTAARRLAEPAPVRRRRSGLAATTPISDERRRVVGLGPSLSGPSSNVLVVALGEIAGRLRRGRACARGVAARQVAAAATPAPPPPPAFSLADGRGASPARRWCRRRRLPRRTSRSGRRVEGAGGHGRRRRRRLEPANAALGEVGARGERLDAQRQALHLEADSRHLGDQPLQHRVVQRVPLRLRALAFGFAPRRLAVDAHLGVERRRDRVGVEEQLEHRREQLAQKAQQPVVRVVDRVVLERVGVGRRGRRDVGGRAGGLAQLVEQARLHRPRVEDGLEPARGQLLNLLRRQIDAVALGDARLDVLDDLIDVGLLDLSRLLALFLGLGRGRRPAVAPPVVAAAAAMEVLATPGLRMLVGCHVDR